MIWGYHYFWKHPCWVGQVVHKSDRKLSSPKSQHRWSPGTFRKAGGWFTKPFEKICAVVKLDHLKLPSRGEIKNIWNHNLVFFSLYSKYCEHGVFWCFLSMFLQLCWLTGVYMCSKKSMVSSFTPTATPSTAMVPPRISRPYDDGLVVFHQPIWKICNRQIGWKSSPGFGVKIKNIWVATTWMFPKIVVPPNHPF